MGIKCCQPCVPPKRHPGCHDTCPDYIKEKAEDAEKKEKDRKRRAVAAGLRDQRDRSVCKALKRRKR